METTCSGSAGRDRGASLVSCSFQSAAPALVAAALRRGEGRLSTDGAFMVEKSAHTGRSVQDKFVVDEPSVAADIWWGKVNERMTVDRFNAFKGRVQAWIFKGRSCSPRISMPAPIRNTACGCAWSATQAWIAAFARNMFIRPPVRELDGFDRTTLFCMLRCSRPTRWWMARVLHHHRPVI